MGSLGRSTFVPARVSGRRQDAVSQAFVLQGEVPGADEQVDLAFLTSRTCATTASSVSTGCAELLVFVETPILQALPGGLRQCRDRPGHDCHRPRQTYRNRRTLQELAPIETFHLVSSRVGDLPLARTTAPLANRITDLEIPRKSPSPSRD